MRWMDRGTKRRLRGKVEMNVDAMEGEREKEGNEGASGPEKSDGEATVAQMNEGRAIAPAPIVRGQYNRISARKERPSK